MKKTIIILLFLFPYLIFSSANYSDWRDKFFREESYKVTAYEKTYKFKDGQYVFDWADSNFQTFSKDNILISSDHVSFYDYNNKGQLIEEFHCMRTCEYPFKDKFFYDAYGRLVQILAYNGRDTIPFMITNQKYKKDLLVFKENFLTWDSKDFNKPNQEILTYYPNGNLKSKTLHEFNTNVKEWRTYIDSMYYNIDNQLIRKEHRELDLELLSIKYYKYNSNNLLIETKDTAITSYEWYKYPLETNVIHSVYYNREEFKYDSDGRIIERIIFKPDYITPYQKITTKYVKTPIIK